MESVATGPKIHPRVSHHELQKIQNYHRKWNRCSWKNVELKWLQQVCGCGKRVRTYFKLNKATILCQECYEDHSIDMEYYFACSTDTVINFSLILASLQTPRT